MGFIKWLVGTTIIDPLLFLLVWNVLAVPMFGVAYTDFMTCFWLSVVFNVIIGAFRLGEPSDDYSDNLWDKMR